MGSLLILTSVKRSEKQLPSKENVRAFLQLNCSNFKLSRVKGIRVPKMLKEIKFERVWKELEVKNCFQRQTFTKY